LRARNEDIPEDRRIEFRIGVNLGDVIVQDDDVFGGRRLTHGAISLVGQDPQIETG